MNGALGSGDLTEESFGEGFSFGGGESPLLAATAASLGLRSRSKGEEDFFGAPLEPLDFLQDDLFDFESLDSLLDVDALEKKLPCPVPPPPPPPPSTCQKRRVTFGDDNNKDDDDDSDKAYDDEDDDDDTYMPKRYTSSSASKKRRLADSTGVGKRAKKVHTVAIPDKKIVKRFGAAIASCPYPECAHGDEGAPCKLGMYYNGISTTSPGTKVRGHCLLWAHYCRACTAWHQVECHGRVQVYKAFRFDAEGEFMDQDGLERQVIAHQADIPSSWWGKPQCGFGVSV